VSYYILAGIQLISELLHDQLHSDPFPVGGPGWASESPQRVGPLCTNPVGSLRGPVQSVQSKDSKHNMLLQNTSLNRFNLFYRLSRLSQVANLMREQQICHEMLAAVSISLPFKFFWLATAAKMA
jgi:hypothetical protein